MQKPSSVAPHAVVPMDPQLEKLKSELREAEREAASLQGNFVVLKQVHVKTQQELAVAQRRIEELQRELVAARRECVECGILYQRLKLAESEAERERQLRALSQKATAAALKDLESVKLELERAKKDLVDGDVNALRASEVALRKELHELKAKVDEKRDEEGESLKSLQAELERERKHRKHTKKAAVRSQQELETLQIELQNAKDAAGGDMESLRQTEASLRRELQELQAEYEAERTRQALSLQSLKEQLVHGRQEAAGERHTAMALQKQVDLLQAEAKERNGKASDDLILLRESEAALRNQLAALKMENEATKKDHLVLQARLQEQEEQHQQLQAEWKQKEANTSSNGVELQRLRAELAEFQRSGVLTKAQLLQEANETNLLREQLDEARASDASSTKKLEEIRKRMQAEASAKDQELQALTVEKQAVDKDKRRVETELEELHRRMQIEEPPKAQELMVLKTAKLTAEKEKQRLANELEKLRQRAQADAMASDQRLEALETEKLEAEKAKQRLETELEELRGRAQREADEQLRALAMAKQEAEKERRRLEVENERLESERRHLKSEVALLMDERLVDAVDTPDPRVAEDKTAQQRLQIEQLQDTVSSLARENDELHRRIEQLMDEMMDEATRTRSPGGDADNVGEVSPRFNARELMRGGSPGDVGTSAEWKNQLAKPKSNEPTAAEKAYAMRYGGRNILARGGDTITYLSK